ncbi:MAG: sensor domain-containing diguanylate cyclase [Candidatus Wallbacteria bacterium]
MKINKENLVPLIMVVAIMLITIVAAFYAVDTYVVFNKQFTEKVINTIPSDLEKKPFKDLKDRRDQFKPVNADSLVESAEAREYESKFIEFNTTDPSFDAANPKSIINKFISYFWMVSGINFIFIIAILISSMYMGIIGSVLASAISSGAVYAIYTMKEIPIITEQLRACYAFSFAITGNGNHDSSFICSLASNYYEIYTFLINLLQFDMQLKIGIFIAAGLICSMIFEKRTSKYFLQIEDKTSELMRLQAENNKLNNSVSDVKKSEEKNRILSARLSSLQTLTRVISKALDPTEVVKESLKVVQQITNAEKCSIWTMDEGSGSLFLKDEIGWKEQEKENIMSYNVEDEKGIVGESVRTGKVMSSTEVHQDYTTMTTGKVMPSKACAPLKHGEKVLGIINIEKFSESVKIEQEEIRMLELISTLTSVAIENANLFKKTEMLANTDGLTKLYTRRYMENFLDTELEKSRRYNHPLSVIISDIDHFKKFNDTYGHQIGDFVLEETARVLKNAVRNVDLPVRYGGEEFFAVLPETDYKGAFVFAERYRKLVEAKEYNDAKTGHKLKVTISIGVASFPLHTKEKTELIKKADSALYMAKEQGRNRVKVAPITKEQLASIQQQAGGH